MAIKIDGIVVAGGGSSNINAKPDYSNDKLITKDLQVTRNGIINSLEGNYIKVTDLNIYSPELDSEFKFKIVDSLPSVQDPNTIYFVVNYNG